MSEVRRDLPVVGLVLAGGRSARMGTDKRRVDVAGMPLLARTCAAIRPLVDPLLIACRAGDPPDSAVVEAFGAALVWDAFEDAGPLAGLEAGLGAAAEAAELGVAGQPESATLVVVAAADMPWLSAELVAYLVRLARDSPHADAVVVASARGTEPFPGVYRPRVIYPVRELLAAGERRVAALLARLELRTVEPAEWRTIDPEAGSLVNVNDPADLGRT